MNTPEAGLWIGCLLNRAPIPVQVIGIKDNGSLKMMNLINGAEFSGDLAYLAPLSLEKAQSVCEQMFGTSVKPPAPPLDQFSRDERTIGQGVAVVDKLPFQAPWLSGLGACVVNIYDVKRKNGRVLFGVGNEEPPILEWVEAEDFYHEWPN